MGTTVLCLFIMEFGFFGPTQAPTNRILTSFTGLVMVAWVMFQTNSESVTAIEMAFMIALYCVKGVAFLMMSPVALMFSNILIATVILLYGLIFAMPVSGLPVFYLLMLYCQSNAPASPATIGNNMSDLLDVCLPITVCNGRGPPRFMGGYCRTGFNPSHSSFPYYSASGYCKLWRYCIEVPEKLET